MQPQYDHFPSSVWAYWQWPILDVPSGLLHSLSSCPKKIQKSKKLVSCTDISRINISYDCYFIWLFKFNNSNNSINLIIAIGWFNKYFYYLFSECAGWYSPWSDGQAHKIQPCMSYSVRKNCFQWQILRGLIWIMVDGLKPGERKIRFYSFKRNFVKEAKVAQFSGYVSEHSAYHHGESFVASTIIEFTCNVMQCELDCTEFLMKINAACRILIWIVMT